MSRRKFYEHLKNCEEKLKLPHDSKGRYKNPEAYKNAAITRNERQKNGEIKPSFLGRKLSEEHKQKIRQGTLKYLDSLQVTGGARYSKKACEYIDKLNEENNWHLQHAENCGEVTCGPYYLDGYDKDLNIAFEYDEQKHHYEVSNDFNLSDHDREKMEYIKNKLQCRFFRYNEKLDMLYEC